ncbi:hypothetical protein PVAP13_6KG290612 [Panicum virgatum]|uniref:Uncharacterized protein n=1 Tax=Panicum virgatum TaxID=38727 RepID=A0A8T0RE58_PANVG|nr:hypothetical protein PVAP13_6KG290612 [Panicum virgatum]
MAWHTRLYWFLEGIDGGRFFLARSFGDQSVPLHELAGYGQGTSYRSRRTFTFITQPPGAGEPVACRLDGPLLRRRGIQRKTWRTVVHRRGRSSYGRALASHARGTGFDSPRLQISRFAVSFGGSCSNPLHAI